MVIVQFHILSSKLGFILEFKSVIIMHYIVCIIKTMHCFSCLLFSLKHLERNRNKQKFIR